MIALIDYGAGNLKSVANALDDLKTDYIITNKSDEIEPHKNCFYLLKN